jgi:hypothetical protein
VRHRRLRTAGQAGETGGGGGPAQGEFERQARVEPGREHADEGVAGAGRIDRRDRQGRHREMRAAGQPGFRPRGAAGDDETAP